MHDDTGVALICDERLKDHIRHNLKCFDSTSHTDKNTRKAAVAVTIVNLSSESDANTLGCFPANRNSAALILTRRSQNLRNHSGQWALPGGRRDSGESPEETALRELSEEVGLALSADRILGRMDDFTTRSGFTITPVVVWGGTGISLSANPAEVHSIHRIPIAEFLREDAPILQSIDVSDQPVLMMPVGDTCIAAPTAAILYQFREVAIRGISTRVAHYEQPYFTWK